MKLIQYTTADTFLAIAQPWLERDEAANNLMLGLALRLRTSTDPFYLITVCDGDDLSLAALMTPPHALTLFSPLQDPGEALDVLASYLLDVGAPVPATSGRTPLAERFAKRWASLKGISYEARMRMCAYQLSHVLPTPPAPGKFRVTDRHDVPLLTVWMRAFLAEALHGEDASAAAEMTQRRIQNRELFVWEVEGLPVSMAGKTRPMVHGITVNMVYTPTRQRGKGYATACVAALSQQLLDEGWQFCTLFADQANPTSNRIYQRIGYEPVCDFDEFAFG
jgi:predicted GNAT family acetyltransferase